MSLNEGFKQLPFPASKDNLNSLAHDIIGFMRYILRQNYKDKIELTKNALMKYFENF